METRRQCARISSEPFDGVFEALSHRLHRQDNYDDGKYDKDKEEDYACIKHSIDLPESGAPEMSGTSKMIVRDAPANHHEDVLDETFCDLDRDFLWSWVATLITGALCDRTVIFFEYGR